MIIIYLNHFNIVTSNTCYRSLCIPSGYNKLSKPPLNIITDEFNNIHVFINALQIIRVDENESTLTLKLQVEIAWNEPRVTLLPNVTIKEMEYIEIEGYILPKEFMNHLWLPDTYVYNVHKIEKQNFIHHFEYLWYWRENNKNWISYETEVEIVIFCKMIFDDYPIDEQVCYFLLGSPADLASSHQWYMLQNIHFNTSDQVALLTYNIEIDNLPENMQFQLNNVWNVTYQRTGFELRLKHNYERYLMIYYIPSGILVILSWVSMYLCFYIHLLWQMAIYFFGKNLPNT